MWISAGSTQEDLRAPAKIPSGRRPGWLDADGWSMSTITTPRDEQSRQAEEGPHRDQGRISIFIAPSAFWWKVEKALSTSESENECEK